MQYIHVKNLEKYNPGYTDRNLIWCKIYFSMINSSYDFENIDDIDKWRLIAIIMLELQMKKPIPYDERWLQRKISTNKRPISLTIKMLHNFVELVTLDEESVYPREEKNRVDKNRIDKSNVHFDFESLWTKYPNRVGKQAAERHFKASVKSDQDYKDIQTALDNYIGCETVSRGFVQNGSTWFNQWRDWITPPKQTGSDLPESLRKFK